MDIIVYVVISIFSCDDTKPNPILFYYYQTFRAWNTSEFSNKRTNFDLLTSEILFRTWYLLPSMMIQDELYRLKECQWNQHRVKTRRKDHHCFRYFRNDYHLVYIGAWIKKICFKEKLKTDRQKIILWLNSISQIRQSFIFVFMKKIML